MGIWRHYHGFWLVVEGSRRFWRILWWSVLLSGVVLKRCYDSKGFLEILRHSLTFWDFERSSEEFSWILNISLLFRGDLRRFMRSERFLKVLYHFLTFWGVLKHYETLSFVLSLSEKILNVLPRSLTFWSVLRYSEAFWHVLIDFEQFWKVADGSELTYDV